MVDSADRFVTGRRWAQAAGVLLLGLAVFTVVSLASYSELDHPNSSRPASLGANWGGRVGAVASYWAFVVLGYGAYGAPFLALLCGWALLRGHTAGSTARRSLGLVGMALVLCAGSGLPTYPRQTAFALGGWFGTHVSAKLLVPYLGRIGASVLLATLFAAALTVATDLRLSPVVRSGRWVARHGWTLLVFTVGLPLHLFRRSGPPARANLEDEEPEADEDEPDPEPRMEPPPGVSRLQSGSQRERWAPVLPDPEEEPLPGEPPAPRSGQRPAAAGASAGAAPAASRQFPAPASPPSSPRCDAGTSYRVPSIDLLDEVPKEQGRMDEEVLLANARQLEEALADFDVTGRVVEVCPGPVVTRYEVEPAAGVKVHRIVTLSDDLARVMSAKGIRIQAPVPGKSVVGVEIANQHHQTVYLREILESRVFRKAEPKLTMALGKTISGEPFVADLARMPHLLVAGATGAGKSVCINCLISSILFKATPEEVRLLMVDPKVVELTIYNGIPHLLVPVVTEPKKAADALKWAVAEMEARYQKLAKLGVRHLADYNRKLERVNQEREEGEEPEQPIPYIVIVIDEFADLMLTAPADVETSLMSLAQKSRAVGIHIILATQRPSVNVITGVIKANFPSRIAFQVASKTDSRTILDLNGAERLLGRGDMLFLPGGQGEPIRIHGAYVSGEETERLVEAIKASGYSPGKVAVFTDGADIRASREGQDELFEEAVQLVVAHQQASTSFLQRRMKIGYSRSARLMDELEMAGVVGPADGAKPRQILVEGDDLGDESDEELAAER
ncbi:MAG: DNA translocase FtsK [Candidatus Latescibacterota bacterium]